MAETATVTGEMRNDKGRIFAIWIATENDGQFVRELWDSVSGDERMGPMTDEEACKEWTDRSRDFRTTVTRSEGVYLRTHAWHPQGDKKELHPDVLRFLKSRGINVKKATPVPERQGDSPS